MICITQLGPDLGAMLPPQLSRNSKHRPEIWWVDAQVPWSRSLLKITLLGQFQCILLYITWLLISCDQAALWMVFSIRLSIRHTFLIIFPSSYHHEIFRGYFQWPKWGSCKRSRSKVKVTEVKTQLNRFRTATPVRIHMWWWNDAQSLMLLRRGAVLFSRSSIKFQGHTVTTKKIVNFDPNWAFPDYNSSLNSPMATLQNDA